MDAAEPITAKVEVELTGNKNQLDTDAPAFTLNIQNGTYTSEKWTSDKSSHKAVTVGAELASSNLTAVVDKVTVSSPDASLAASTDADRDQQSSTLSTPGSNLDLSPQKATAAADDNAPSPYDDITAEPEHWNLPSSATSISAHEEASTPSGAAAHGSSKVDEKTSGVSQDPATMELAGHVVGSSKDGLEPLSVQPASGLDGSQEDRQDEPDLATHSTWLKTFSGAVDYASGMVDSVRNLTANISQPVIPESLHGNASAPSDAWVTDDMGWDADDLAEHDEL